MRKEWKKPELIGLEVNETNTTEGVYYNTNFRATLVCRGIGVRNADGSITIKSPCGESIRGATLEEAKANWNTHCTEAHPGQPLAGEELTYGRIS